MAGYIGKSLATGGTAVDAYSKTQSDAAYLKLTGGLMTGGVRQGVLAKDADYTVQTGDPNVFLVTTAGSNRTMTLPAASAVGGQVYRFVKVDTGAGKLIIARAGSDTIGINANLTMELWFQDNYVDIMSDGTSRWVVMSTETFQIPHGSRSTGTGVPNGATTLTTWTEADYSTGNQLVPAGTSHILMRILMYMPGDAATDSINLYLRKEGSSASNDNSTAVTGIQHSDMPSGDTMRSDSHVITEVNIERKLEWYMTRNTGTSAASVHMFSHGYRLG